VNRLVLIRVMIGGTGMRHFMNPLPERGRAPRGAWLTPAAVMAAIALDDLMLITRIPAALDVEVTYAVGFARAQEIIVKRCVPCHSTHPADPAFRRRPTTSCSRPPSR